MGQIARPLRKRSARSARADLSVPLPFASPTSVSLLPPPPVIASGRTCGSGLARSRSDDAPGGSLFRCCFALVSVLLAGQVTNWTLPLAPLTAGTPSWQFFLWQLRPAKWPSVKSRLMRPADWRPGATIACYGWLGWRFRHNHVESNTLWQFLASHPETLARTASRGSVKQFWTVAHATSNLQHRRLKRAGRDRSASGVTGTLASCL
jgi:hypothetical protein